jgi:hypothetical protein
MDTGIFDAVFWSFFITTIVGFILKMTSMAYKSKCKEVSCCCLKIVRDTEAEEKEEEFRITHTPQVPLTPQEGESTKINSV